jgi:hypothetical protein
MTQEELEVLEKASWWLKAMSSLDPSNLDEDATALAFEIDDIINKYGSKHDQNR